MVRKFKCWQAAVDESRLMVGWIIRIERIDEENGCYYVIRCNVSKYLRSDGFVR